MILLNRQNIIERLENKETSLYLMEEISSTNDFFNPIQNFSIPSVCIAEKQSAARGRLQRKWYVPPYKNLSLSILYRFQKDVTGLNLVAGLAVRKAIEEHLQDSSLLKVKWPNDIIYSREKIAGILIESKIIHDIVYVITGIGININMENDNLNINREWTSLKNITNTEHDRNILAAKVINYVLSYYQAFDAYGLDHFIKYWHDHDLLLNRQITVTENSIVYKGKYVGINHHGMLGIELNDGAQKWVNYGDASIDSIKE